MATAPPTDVCKHFPELSRLIYCYGQMLSAKDFIDEQTYFRNKIALHNRCLHGYGVICGLLVESAPTPAQQQANKGTSPPLHLTISCGFALDACGRELVPRYPLCFDFWQCVDPTDEREILDRGYAWVTICYHESKEQKTKLPVDVNECKDLPESYIYTRWKEQVCVKVVPDGPPGQSCDPCCEPICGPDGDCCVWLAKVELDCSDLQNVTLTEIDNSIRRHITEYELAKISHINWVHGGRYSRHYSEWLLGRFGLLFRFSAPVRTETLDDGVADVWKIHEWPEDLPDAERKKTGRKKKSPGSPGRVESLPVELYYADDEYTDWLRIRVLDVDDCGIGTDDRIMITLRGDFILDKCCQPLDGNHFGGRVPLIPRADYEEKGQLRDQLASVCTSDEFTDSAYNYDQLVPSEVQSAATNLKTACNQAHWRHTRLTSGNGVPGGTFESWFFTTK